MKMTNAKSRAKWSLGRVAFLMMAMVLLMSVFTGCVDDLSADPSQKRLVTPSASVATGDYKDVFADTNILHLSPVFGENIASYAYYDEDGFISCYDYAYKGDAVKEFAKTDYIFTEGYDEESLAFIIDACEEDKASYDGINCAQASYTVGDSYITCKVVFRNIEDKDSLKELYELELVDREDCDYLSMKSCEDLWLGEGYAKK